MAVTQDLDLDVPGPLDELLAVDLRGPEGGRCLRLTGREGRRRAGPLAHDPHPAPAATRGGLEDHGIAEAIGHLHDVLAILQRLLAPRHDGNARLPGDVPGLRLVTHEPDG